MKKREEEKILTAGQIARRRFFRNRLATAGLIIVVSFVFLSLFAPLFTDYTVSQTDLRNLRSGPSAAHLLGTDDLGRDIFARLLYGGRVSIAVGVASMLLQMAIGVTLGAAAGYFGGVTDKVIMPEARPAVKETPSWPWPPTAGTKRVTPPGFWLSCF